jgi:aminoglycoside phosphotransferase (APT) family kinase protein
VGARPGPIIRHGDLWPPNVVCRDGVPVALIDWDFAQPGTALEDVASAAKHWVPLIAPARAPVDGWPDDLGDLTRRGERLRLLCDEYGLGVDDRAAVLETVVRNAGSGYASHKQWGEAGVPGFAEMWQAGSGFTILGDRDWMEASIVELQALLR